jgi:hypothetical protein
VSVFVCVSGKRMRVCVCVCACMCVVVGTGNSFAVSSATQLMMVVMPAGNQQLVSKFDDRGRQERIN